MRQNDDHQSHQQRHQRPADALFGLSWRDLLRVDLAVDLEAIVRPEAIQERIRQADGAKLITAESRWVWANSQTIERYRQMGEDAAMHLRAAHADANERIRAERREAREHARRLFGLSPDQLGRVDVRPGWDSITFRKVFPCVPWFEVRVEYITVSKETGRACRVTETIQIPELVPAVGDPCGRCGAEAIRHVPQPRGDRVRQECAGCGRLIAWLESKIDVDRVNKSLPERTETALATALKAEEDRVASQVIAERGAAQDAVERSYVDELQAIRDPSAGVNGEIGAGLYFTTRLETVFFSDLYCLSDVVVFGKTPYYRLTPKSLGWVVKAGKGIAPGSRDHDEYVRVKESMFKFAEALGITPAMVRAAIASGEAELPLLTHYHKTTYPAPMESGLRVWSWSTARDGGIESVRAGKRSTKGAK